MTAPGVTPTPRPAPAVPPEGSVAHPRRGSWRRALPSIGWVGLGILALFVVLAVASPWLARYEPRALSTDSLDPPSAEHWLGTNQLGQDLGSQLLAGARVSLAVAAVTATGTLVLAVAVGVASGWLGGRVDTLLMGVVDVVLAAPRLPLLVVIAAFAGRDLTTVAVGMALVFWPGPARMIRAQVRAMRQRLDVVAAASFGAGPGYLIRNHVLPDIGLVLVAALVGAAGRAVLFEASLAFLGVGDPFRTSWGSMVRDAREVTGIFYSNVWTWWVLPPVVAIVLLLLALTFVGAALEERVNPRVARHRTEGADR